MKAIVLKDCIDSNKNFLAKKTIIEYFNEEKEAKLLTLGLVVEYDELKHSKLASNLKTFDNSELVAKDEEIASLNEKLVAKDKELLKMSEVIADLVSLVEEATQLPKGQVPDGFSKYKGE